MNRFHPLLILLLLLPACLRAQVTGRVTDAETGEGLPFVRIQALTARAACLSDLNGRFTLPLSHPDSLRMTLLGYQTQTYACGPGRDSLFTLRPGGIELETVVLLPVENPAFRLIRGAWANRGIHDPTHWPAWSCESYNKLRLAPPPDSAAASLKDSIYLFLIESLNQKSWTRPGPVQETVRASHVSGYPGKALPLTAEALQGMSLYDEYLKIVSFSVLSPLSPLGLQRYRYLITDTLLQGKDSIFTVHFEPRKTFFNALEGTVMIHSRSFAVVGAEGRIHLQEADPLFTGGYIRQFYQPVGDSLWFPEQLQTDLDMLPDKSLFRSLHLTGRSWFRNLRLEPATAHPAPALVVQEDAGEQDSLLQAHRVQVLDARETRTYHLLDSLGRVMKLPQLMDQMYRLQDGYLALGPVNLDLLRLLSQNQVEGIRLGAGLVTNEKLSNAVSLGAWAGYGLRDEALKYGGMIRIHPWGVKKALLGVEWVQDLAETGGRRLLMVPATSLLQDGFRDRSARTLYMQDMDYQTRAQVWLGFRPLRRLELRMNLLEEYSRPVTDTVYRFRGETDFVYQEAQLMLRWAPTEKVMEQGVLRLSTPGTAPVLSLSLLKSLDQPTLLMHQAHAVQGYWRWDAALEQRILNQRGWSLYWRLTAGANSRAMPYSRLYVYRGAYFRTFSPDIVQTFGTMRMNEFAADRYQEAFLRFSPPLRWLGAKNWRPRLSFMGAVAYGQLLSDPGDHALTRFTAPTQGYFEAGVALRSFIPDLGWSMLTRVLTQTFYIGAWYRMGPYALPAWQQNLRIGFGFGQI